MNVTDLRKAFSAQGIKGFSSANRATFTAFIEAAEVEAYAEDAARTPAPAPVATAPKKGICEDCGRKVGNSGHDTLCTACYEYASWENTHSDDAHEQHADSTDEQIESMVDCPVCHPELDPRKPRSAGKSRAGMVIVAKGTELHKSATFKAAAEAAGWTVSILGSVVTEVQEDGETFEIERYVARATKGKDTLELAWNGRAYDYPGSSAHFGGKARKVRNLKEALRLL